MSAETIFLIHDPASLGAWRQRLLSTLFARKLPAVQIRIPEFTALENVDLSVRASHLQQVCGCGASGFCMSAALAATLLAYFGSGNTFADIGATQVLSLLGSLILAALCGKTAALLWARWQLLTLAARMHDRIAQVSPHKVYR
jgi:hypothetical protein